MDDAVQWDRRSLFRVAGVGMLTAGLAACSAPGSAGSGAGAAGQGLPATIKIMSIRSLTGTFSFATQNAQKGIDLAVEQIAADKLLGASTLQIDTKDAASTAQQAASFFSQAVADPGYAAVLGPEGSAQALAVSPIAQSGRLPVVYVQSGSKGVLIGDYTYRLTPPTQSYFPIVGDYLTEKKITTASVLYNSGNPTLSELGQAVIPPLAQQKGVRVLGSSAVELAAQDFTTAASEIARQAPGVAFLMLTGPQYAVAITALRQAGYTGEIVGISAMGAGNLKSAAAVATGAVWPTNFTATQTAASSQKYVAAYKAKYGGETPNNYSAEAYDATIFLAKGIAAAGSVDRTAIQRGLDTVARQTLDGAQGPVTFDGHDARVPGVLVRWNGTGEELVTGGAS